jgi:hypothetical protein
MKLQLVVSTLVIVVMWGLWAFLQNIGTKQLGWQTARRSLTSGSPRS